MSANTHHDIGSPLISANELLAIHAESDVKVFDVRGRFSSPPASLRDDYLRAHIPGAVFLDWMSDFLEQGVRPGLASVSDADNATRSFQSLGINRHDRVVIYDDYHHMFAGRIWWAMRYWGHENVKVLDGGWKHWETAGFQMSPGPVSATRGNFTAQRRDALRIGMHDFIKQRDSSIVIDARGTSGYAGTDDDKLSGHIPGAINVPYADLLDADTGLFKSTATLKAVLDDRVPDWSRSRVIASCGSGYSATVLMLAIKQLGFDLPLFDESFAGWKQDESRPIERGAGLMT